MRYGEVRRLRWERFLVTLGAGDVTDDTDRTADSWADKERLPTWSLLRRLLAGEPLPASWRLVRQVRLSLDMIDDAMLSAWVDAGHLDRITGLSIMTPALTLEALHRSCARLPALRRVEIGARTAAGWSPAQLRTLSRWPVSDDWLLSRWSSAQIEALLEAEVCQNLRALRISGVQDHARPWWTSARLRQLHTFDLFMDDTAGPVPERQLAALAAQLPDGLRALSVRLERTATPFKAQPSLPLPPLLARHFPDLTSLDLSRNGLTDKMLQDAPLLRSDHVRRLDLSYNPLGNATLLTLGHRLGSVEELDLRGTRVGAKGPAAVPAGDRLRAVDLSGTRCTTNAVTRLLRDCGAGLRLLALENTKVDSAFVAKLGAELPLPRLEALFLCSCPLDGDAFVHLLTGAELPRLETLDLRFSQLGHCDVRQPPRLPALRELHLDHTAISVPEPTVLFDPDGLPRLELLHAADNRLPREAAGALAAFARRRPLLDLNLEDSLWWSGPDFAEVLTACAAHLIRAAIEPNRSNVAPAVAKVLAGEAFPMLTHLDLRSFDLAPDDLAAIMLNPSLGELAQLTFYYYGYSPDELQSLRDSPLLGRLEYLNAYGEDPDTFARVLTGSPHYRPYVVL